MASLVMTLHIHICEQILAQVVGNSIGGRNNMRQRAQCDRLELRDLLNRSQLLSYELFTLLKGLDMGRRQLFSICLRERAVSIR